MKTASKKVVALNENLFCHVPIFLYDELFKINSIKFHFSLMESRCHIRLIHTAVKFAR
jgi:hypothetical protein